MVKQCMVLEEVTSCFTSLRALINRWWHKCMSPMGNANQLAMVKQYMILEEMQSGSTGQVTDGRMFKQTVLTPEVINSRKKQAEVDALKLRSRMKAGSRSSSRVWQGWPSGSRKEVGAIFLFRFLKTVQEIEQKWTHSSCAAG